MVTESGCFVFSAGDKQAEHHGIETLEGVFTDEKGMQCVR